MTASLRITSWRVEAAGQALLKEVDVHFAGGGAWGVIGRSGAGKSVLLKSALGLLPARAGFVELARGSDAIRAEAGDATAFARLRQHIAFVPQDPALLDDLTVEQNVAFAISRLRRLSPAQVRSRVHPWLERLGLAPSANLNPARLPPGQQRKIALCRALTLEPDILIVDEATTGLDPRSAAEITTSLQELAARGTTLILISHDIRCLRALSPDLVWVHRGRIGYQGPYPKHPADIPPDLVPLLYGASPIIRAPVEGRT